MCAAKIVCACSRCDLRQMESLALIVMSIVFTRRVKTAALFSFMYLSSNLSNDIYSLAAFSLSQHSCVTRNWYISGMIAVSRRCSTIVDSGLLRVKIYTYDLPSMISRKFAYADDLKLLHSSGNWKDLEGTLSQDMYTLSAYLQTWRLKLSHTKTVTAAFHLNNREAKHELKVYNNGTLG